MAEIKIEETFKVPFVHYNPTFNIWLKWTNWGSCVGLF